MEAWVIVYSFERPSAYFDIQQILHPCAQRGTFLRDAELGGSQCLNQRRLP
jgi:hypothetical protein